MDSTIQKWQALTQKPRIVEFFAGLFEKVGIKVTDIGEELSCHHHGDHIEIRPGLLAAVDYTVEIDSHQVDRLASYVIPGELDENEKFRSLCVVFTPATAATLKNPMFSNPILRWLAGAENLIHVHLDSPSPELKGTSHTLIYVARQWVVIPGLHGQPRRIYRMSMEDALAYQRRVFAAMKANSVSGWISFSRWYKRWRKARSMRS